MADRLSNQDWLVEHQSTHGLNPLRENILSRIAKLNKKIAVIADTNLEDGEVRRRLYQAQGSVNALKSLAADLGPVVDKQY